MRSNPIKVGFDLDGVLLYNPVRIARPVISFFKRAFLHKKKLAFYYPKTDLEKRLWRLIHKSSIFIAPGFSQISELVKQKKIKAYIITARYSFLGPELLKWAEKNGFGSVFTEIHYNAKDEQPHLFKARLINKLKLDYFVEDNLDIVRYVEGKTQTTILWIYNIFDKGVYYPRRYPYLKKAVEYIRRAIRKRT
jgi:hypothetical protein